MANKEAVIDVEGIEDGEEVVDIGVKGDVASEVEVVGLILSAQIRS